MTNTTDVKAAASSVFSDMVDGMAGLFMLKSDVTLDTFGKRLGVFLPSAIIGAVVNGRVLVKKGLQSIDEDDAEKVIMNTPLGGITLGKM